MESDSTVTMIYVPCGRQDEAARLASTLLGEHLIACANVYESRSLYRWNGAMSDEPEYVMVCKTTPARSDEVERRVLQLHSYQVPCVLRIETARANRAYVEWVRNEVTQISQISTARE